MAFVFKTAEDSPNDVEIVGVGMARAHGEGFISAEKAASILHELWTKDKDGKLVLDEDGSPKPLTGNKLNEVAKQFAADRGLVYVSLTQNQIDTGERLHGITSTVETPDSSSDTKEEDN